MASNAGSTLGSILEYLVDPKNKSTVSKIFSFLNSTQEEKEEKKNNKTTTPSTPTVVATPKPKKKKKDKKPLWDIPGISEADKQEIMKLVADTDKVKQETEDKVRRLVKDYKKPKPKPVRRQDRPLPPIPVEDEDEPAPPPPPRKRRPLPPIPSEEDEDIPPPLPPRSIAPPPPSIPLPMEDEDIPPPLPPRNRPLVQETDPVMLEDISVPVPPSPLGEPRTQRQETGSDDPLLRAIVAHPRLRHVTPQPRAPVRNPDLVEIMRRRFPIAGSDDEAEPEDDDSDWLDGYGHKQGRAIASSSSRRGRGRAVSGRGIMHLPPGFKEHWAGLMSK